MSAEVSVDTAGSVVTESHLDVEAVRRDFPALHQEIHGHPLVYLDNAASAQKPQAVIDAMVRGYSLNYSNVHRGVHTLSQRATDDYEKARSVTRAFLGAQKDDEIVFVRGTTEAINLVAWSYARPRLQEGDEILITHMEHHSNIVPWQLVCEATGAKLVVAPIDDQGRVDMEAFRSLLSERTKMVSVVHISNALGTINPVREMTEAAHAVGAKILVDGAQAAPHGAVDVQDIGCDFYAVSSHKLFGPTGIGALYGRYELLESMDPYQGGGEMILYVSFEKTEFNVAPHKFEAGTPNIVGAVGMAAAMTYLTELGFDKIAAHEADLLAYAQEQLGAIPQVKIVGTSEHKASVVSFTIDGAHPHDIGTILDHQGVAVRAGHHCAQPIMDRFGIPATARASFALYNTREDVDRLVSAVNKVIEMFC